MQDRDGSIWPPTDDRDDAGVADAGSEDASWWSASATSAQASRDTPAPTARPAASDVPLAASANGVPDPVVPPSELEDRLAALERRLLRITERLDELPMRLGERLDAAASVVTARVSAAGRQAESGVAETLERAEEILGEHSRELSSRLERLEERASAAVRGTEAATTAMTERSEEALRAMSRDVNATLEGVDERSGAAVGLAERAVTALMERSTSFTEQSTEAVETLTRDVTAVLDQVVERSAAAARSAEEATATMQTRSEATAEALARDVTHLLERVEAQTKAAIGEPLRRWESTLDALTRSSSELAASVEGLASLVDRAGRETDRGIGHLHELSSRSERTVDALDASLEQLASEAARVQEETARSRKELTTSRRHLETRVMAAIDSALEGFVTEATEAALSATHASDQLDRAVGSLGELERTLAAHRRQLDATLQRERAALLDDLLDRLVDGLARRERRRLAEELLDQRGRDGGAVPSSDASAGTASPSPLPAVKPFEELVPAEPAGASYLVDPSTSGSSANAAREELYAVVTSVPGIGPGRATAIVDAYADLDELAASSTEELAELAGFPWQLAEDVLAHVHGLDR